MAYLPTSSDRAAITDYYIFLLGGNTLKYSKWNTGSTFHPFTWTDLTNVPDIRVQPDNYFLSQNYPNPFNPSTIISYQIPEISFVTLNIYDVSGNKVITLVNGEKPAGEYEIEFSMGQDSSPVISSGIYFYKLIAGNFTDTKKMVLAK